MQIVLDSDVQAVVDFMRREVPANKLRFVAKAIARVAELAWSEDSPTPAPQALMIRNEPLVLGVNGVHD